MSEAQSQLYNEAIKILTEEESNGFKLACNYVI